MLQTEKACVSPEQLEHMVRTRASGWMPPDQEPLYDMLSGSIFWRYVRKYPGRREVLGAILDGVRPKTAAQGICDERLARKWAEHYFATAALRIDEVAHEPDIESIRDLLTSICSLTHGRADRSGGGAHVRIGATTCLGCTVSAA